MTHTLKRTFAMLLLAIFGSTLLYNCEPDPDSLGQQLFDKDAAVGTETLYDVVAFNISNNDSIRSDASRLVSEVSESGSTLSAILGAFNEGQFGMQRASYITQLRMPVDNFDFNGPKAQVDSVVLVLRTPANTANNTYYIADSLKAPGAYDNNDFLINGEKVPVSIEKKSYPIRKYGKVVKSMKINVQEVTTFLDINNTDVFTRSNVNVNTGALLGSAVFDGNVSTVTVTKKSDNSNVFSGNLGFRIPLDKDFFQTHIIDKKGKPELQDASNFTRYFKGIRLSVENTDGYLFPISANDMELIMYYKYDQTDNGTVTRPQTSLKFNLGSINAHIGQYEYDRSSSAVSTALATSNKTTGDPLLYLQGMGGPSVGVKISDDTIAELKERFKNNKTGIIGATIRIYMDKDKTWTKPHFGEADRKFILSPYTYKTDNTIDYSKWNFSADTNKGFPIYYHVTSSDYYDFVVTQTLKDIVEGKSDKTFANNDPLLINAGSFLRDAKGAAYGARFTTRAIDMNRIVMIGSDKSDKRIQLRVTYSTASNK